MVKGIFIIFEIYDVKVVKQFHSKVIFDFNIN